MGADKLILILLLFLPLLLLAQKNDSISDKAIHPKRLRTLVITGGVGYGITLVGLNELWYKDSPRQSFRFFNDNAEWKQVDKVGHFYSAFYLSYGAAKSFQWCGLPDKRAHVLGALTGFLVMLPIEILDGHSAAYGASVGDLAANAAGSLFYLGQMMLWSDPKIYPKFSFRQTEFSKVRPDVLGASIPSQILKDYNGQTYWFSFDMDKFIRFPAWLNVAVGYGATNMVYARDEQNNAAGYHAYRQYYIALDPDLTGIKTNSKLLKTLFSVVSLIKIPAPGVEFSKEGARFSFLY